MNVVLHQRQQVVLSRCRYVNHEPRGPLHIIRCKHTGTRRTLHIGCSDGSGLHDEAVEAYACPSHAKAVVGIHHTVEQVDWHDLIIDKNNFKRLVVIVGGQCDAVEGETTWDVLDLQRMVDSSPVANDTITNELCTSEPCPQPAFL